MADDFVVGPFGRLLPRPTTWTTTVLSQGTQANDTTKPVDKMMPRGPFSKDVPLNSEPSGQSQQLPPVSQILGGRAYRDLAPPERPSSQQGLAIFHRPQYNRGNSGDVYPGPSGSYGHPSHTHRVQTHYRQRSDVLPPSPFSQSSPFQGASPRNNQVSSFLARSDERTISRSDTAQDQPRAPKVLREEDIPGKGVCYIYDDGSVLPKAIDGNSVNPQWGVTKAGKPRKRLAQACTTCREKKIRCDPGSSSSKCSQCLKFNRDCKFEQQIM